MPTMEDYATKTPIEFRNWRRTRRWFWRAVAILVVPTLTKAYFDHDPGPAFILSIFVFPILILWSAISKIKMENAFGRLKNIRDKDLEDQIGSAGKGINEMKKYMSNISSKGHVVMAGDGSTVIIDSTVTNSFNRLKNDDPALADAIANISGVVEKSGNKDAGKVWATFLKQSATEKDPIIMKSLWDRLIGLVPDVTTIIESAATISKLFV